MASVKKMILVDSCDNCPQAFECDAWAVVSQNEMAKFMVRDNDSKFIIDGCQLPDMPDNEE